MLLKVIVYGNMNNIYSSRKLEEAVQQNIHFMWLSGMKRCADVEPVFANIKNNHMFRRFMLRGPGKVSIEAGLLVIAHNSKP